MDAKPVCWWCCHSFDWESLHFPFGFRSNVFRTTGHFCSWGCMKAYGIQRNDPRFFDLITLMRKRIEGKITPIKTAPSRYSLKLFGGPLSIEEFRSGIPVRMFMPGELYQEPLVETTRETQTTGMLQLKREKPLKRDCASNKLEASLGIIRKKCLDGAAKQ